MAPSSDLDLVSSGTHFETVALEVIGFTLHVDIVRDEPKTWFTSIKAAPTTSSVLEPTQGNPRSLLFVVEPNLMLQGVQGWVFVGIFFCFLLPNAYDATHETLHTSGATMSSSGAIGSTSSIGSS